MIHFTLDILLKIEKDNQKSFSFLGNLFMKKVVPLNLLCQMSFKDLRKMPCLTQIPLFYQQVLLLFEFGWREISCYFSVLLFLDNQ